MRNNNNDDDDIDFKILRTTNGVEITNNNDDNDDVRFVKQTSQHPKDRLARALRNQTPTVEVDTDVLEIIPHLLQT